MRILHVITSLRIGGAERMVAELLPRLRDRGHHVEALLFDGTRTPLYDRLEREGIAIRALGRGAWQMWNPLHLLPLRRFIRRGRFDIVHTHNTSCQLLAAMAAGRTGANLVTTEHNVFNRRRNWPWYEGVDRWMYGRYRYAICVGADVRRSLAARLAGGGVQPAIAVVPNGVDLKRFFEAPAGDSLREAADEGRNVVVMVSAFRRQKDHATLLRAMSHLPDTYRLWLVGDWVRRSACESLAAELGISGRVRFWGFREDVPALMAASDVVVLSSHYEGMSLASIEGMASGKPFIASDVAGLHEVVEGAGLLFPHEDDRELAAMIRRVCEDRSFGAEVAARCRERAARYDMESVVSGYERIYCEVAERKQMI